MGVPKKRLPKGRRNKRRMHLFAKRPVLVRCPKCGKLMRAHTVCPNCGYYKGMEAIDILKKLTKKERKKREKEMKAKEKEEKKDTRLRGYPREKPLTWEELSKK